MITDLEKNLIKSLLDIGLHHNDNIHVHVSMFPLVYISRGEDNIDISAILYNSLRQVIGESALISALTATWETARYNQDYIVESTPTSKDLGIFSEYLRLHTLSSRTEHPIFSMCFNGPSKLREAYLKNTHRYAFGISSPWDIMFKNNFQILFIGLEKIKHMSLVHHVEQMIGVPYCYNKIFSKRVYNNKKLIEGEFFYSVPYRDMNIIYSDLSNIQKLMLEKGILRESYNKGLHLKLLSLKDTFVVIRDSVLNNPYILLENIPEYKFGKEPMDIY